RQFDGGKLGKPWRCFHQHADHISGDQREPEFLSRHGPINLERVFQLRTSYQKLAQLGPVFRTPALPAGSSPSCTRYSTRSAGFTSVTRRVVWWHFGKSAPDRVLFIQL